MIAVHIYKKPFGKVSCVTENRSDIPRGRSAALRESIGASITGRTYYDVIVHMHTGQQCAGASHSASNSAPT